MCRKMSQVKVQLVNKTYKCPLQLQKDKNKINWWLLTGDKTATSKRPKVI